MPAQRNKHVISHLKVSLEAIFSKMIWLSKQKSFHLSGRELHDECSVSISVKIICFQHLQQGSYEKIQEYVQPNASQVATMMALWKIITVFHSSSWNFIIPALRHILCLPKASKIYGESGFESSASQNKLGKHKFFWFKKRDFYF